MKEKQINVIEKAMNQVVTLHLGLEKIQIIPVHLEGDQLSFERYTKGYVAMQTGEAAQIIVDEWIFSGIMKEVSYTSNKYVFVIEEAETYSRRNHVRALTLIKGTGTLTKEEQETYSLYQPEIEDGSNAFPIYILDVSGGGMGIKTPRYFEKGDILHLYSKLFGDVDLVVKHVQVDRKSNETMYRLGTMYLDITERHREKIIRQVFKILQENLKR